MMMMMPQATGKGVLCFPDNGDWFQGYFTIAYSPAFLEVSQKTLGLLGIEEPIDDWYTNLLNFSSSLSMKLAVSDVHMEVIVSTS